MALVWLALGAVGCSALALAGYAWRRPYPQPAPAAPISLTELHTMRRRIWDSRTPLATLEAPTLHPWPEDAAAELLAAWRDQTGRCA